MIEHIIKFSFKYKLLVVLLFVGVCGAGIYSLVHLPIDAFPDVAPTWYRSLLRQRAWLPKRWNS